MDKASLRKMMLEKRKALPRKTKENLDQALEDKLLMRLEPYHKIAVFISLKDEFNTLPLIEKCLKTKLVYAPVCVEDSLEFYRLFDLNNLNNGPFNLKEPFQHERIDIIDLDVILVPLLAYDTHFHRLGYGKGYYDRILERAKLSIGVAYPFQKVDILEIEAHDIPLHEVIV